MIEIHPGDNLEVLRALPAGSFDLVYLDPPLHTGTRQARRRPRTVRDPEGDRTGFGGARNRTEVLGEQACDDRRDDRRGAEAGPPRPGARASSGPQIDRAMLARCSASLKACLSFDFT